VAKRIDWEKEAKRLKVVKQGFRSLWEDLPIPTGSRAQQRAIAKQQRGKLSKKSKQALALQSPTRKMITKVKVFRRREGEGILPVRNPPKGLNSCIKRLRLS
jgi:hypothetical protein